MALEFRTVTVPIGNTSGTFTSNQDTTFSSGVRSADAAIKQYKLEFVGAAHPVDIAQVGVTSVTFDHTTVEFTVKARYSTSNSGVQFTGEVHVLVIADTF